MCLAAIGGDELAHLLPPPSLLSPTHLPGHRHVVHHLISSDLITECGGGGAAGRLDSQVTCHQFVSVTDVATQGGVDIRIALFSLRLEQQQKWLTLLTREWGLSGQQRHSLMKVAWDKVGGSTLWTVLSGRLGEAGSQPGVCRSACQVR